MRRLALFAMAPALLAVACDRIIPQRADTELPPIETVEASYLAHGVSGAFEYNGNVVEITVVQPQQQLQRGGSLWARVGPYIYLFSPATRELFQEYEGVAAVRVITRTSDGVEIARALLARDRLNAITWQRTLNILGIALRDGSERPVEMQRLVDWGERHTDHRYNQRFAPGWGTGAR